MLLLFFIAQRSIVAHCLYSCFILRFHRAKCVDRLYCAAQGVRCLLQRRFGSFEFCDRALQLRELLLLRFQSGAHVTKLGKVCADQILRLCKFLLLGDQLFPRCFGLRFELLAAALDLFPAILQLLLAFLNSCARIIQFCLGFLKLRTD